MLQLPGFGKPEGGELLIRVELAGAPQGKGRPRFTTIKPKDKPAFVTTYTPKATRTYETHLKHEATLAMKGRPPCLGAVAVRIVATMPIPKSWSNRKKLEAADGFVRPTGRPDWENIAKMLDAFNEVVWKDDAQVVQGLVEKRYGDRPSLLVEVYEL